MQTITTAGHNGAEIANLPTEEMLPLRWLTQDAQPQEQSSSRFCNNAFGTFVDKHRLKLLCVGLIIAAFAFGFTTGCVYMAQQKEEQP
ncbi:hypothetical protein [Candidatus Ichthyocystis hellenicum]|uniref:hypothetical protein n=1 Tax=Candidatus Ichthyocystis hellenicum TaxID=1561003 RepID=UPI000B885AAF|nr:hypothetical protein [Candidatus Ichthyocystis hellenicum]